MEPEVEQKIGEVIRTFTGSAGIVKKAAVGGSSLNHTFRFSLLDHHLFCKVNNANKFPQLFKKEKNALEFLKQKSGMRVPTIIDCFTLNDQQVLLMEWIEEGEKTSRFWKNFGRKLAEMHQVNAGSFGWKEDNYMGLIPQSNKLREDWVSFFREERLEPLCHLCIEKNLLNQKHRQLFQALYTRLPSVFGLDQKPSLLHGDLWGGNFIAAKDGEPVLIDPALYFGHPSADLGMTILFGGFDQDFYDSYQYHFPFPHNHKEQWKVANLYPLLIHLLLFGQIYLPRIEQTLFEFE